MFKLIWDHLYYISDLALTVVFHKLRYFSQIFLIFSDTIVSSFYERIMPNAKFKTYSHMQVEFGGKGEAELPELLPRSWNIGGLALS